jgi:hypothetical protein
MIDSNTRDEALRFERGGNASGTFRQGSIPSTLTVADLEAVFGKSEGPGDKSEFEWTIRFADGLVATVYDYHGCRWHVGGRAPWALERVGALLGVEVTPW